MAIYPSKISVFLLGFAIGVIIAFIALVSRTTFPNTTNPNALSFGNTHSKIEHDYYQQWLKKRNYITNLVNFDYFAYSGNKSLGNLLEYKLLKAKVSLLCVMFVKKPENAYTALNTWMKRCNNFKFFSTTPVKYLDVTVIRPSNSWHYLCEVLRHIDHNFDSYKWILFVPDDVFAIPENLRYYVFGMNADEPYYFGHTAKLWNEYYNLAQGGYVLSVGSVKALVDKFSSSEKCRSSGKYWKNEDFYLGKYLAELGVSPMDTRDEFGRGRFHLFTPTNLAGPGNKEVLMKYWKNSLYPPRQGLDCCSPQSITFRARGRDFVYFYYYLLYNLHRHTEPGSLGNLKSNTYTPSEEIWQQFVLDELGPNANLSAITHKKYYNLWLEKIEPPSIFNKKLRALFRGENDDE